MSRHLMPPSPQAIVRALVCGAAIVHAVPALAQAAPGDNARGKYLVDTSGCIDCHTPWKMGAKGPEPDLSRHLSGHPEALKMPPAPVLPEGPWLVTSAATNTAFAGPWGVSFTANLTPDPDTGLGQWTPRESAKPSAPGATWAAAGRSCRRCRSRSTTTLPTPTWTRSMPTCEPSRR